MAAVHSCVQVLQMEDTLVRVRKDLIILKITLLVSNMTVCLHQKVGIFVVDIYLHTCVYKHMYTCITRACSVHVYSYLGVVYPAC